MSPQAKVNAKVALGLALGFAIGFGCRAAGLPVPAPPALAGALLVVAMTLGYTVVDRLLAHRGLAAQAANCGGPTGAPPSTAERSLR